MQIYRHRRHIFSFSSLYHSVLMQSSNTSTETSVDPPTLNHLQWLYSTSYIRALLRHLSCVKTNCAGAYLINSNFVRFGLSDRMCTIWEERYN